MRRTLSILNCVIELHGSVYPPEPIRTRPLDARVSAALQKAPASGGTNIRRDVARFWPLPQKPCSRGGRPSKSRAAKLQKHRRIERNDRNDRCPDRRST